MSRLTDFANRHARLITLADRIAERAMPVVLGVTALGYTVNDIGRDGADFSNVLSLAVTFAVTYFVCHFVWHHTRPAPRPIRTHDTVRDADGNVGTVIDATHTIRMVDGSVVWARPADTLTVIDPNTLEETS